MTPENSPRLLRVFRAGQISTSLRDAVTVQYDDDVAEAYEQLMVGRFDQAPVMKSGHVIGWVKTAKLRSAPKVTGVLMPLSQSAITSAEAPMADALELLGTHEFVFTVEERISGFIAPSDLDRHAARSHFYLLISATEMLLAELVRRTHTEESIERRIRNDMRDRWEEARSANSEAHPVEYLYLEDLTELFLDARGDTPPWSPALTARLTDICHLRPRVMHPTRSLTAGRSASQLAAVARGAEQVTLRLSEMVGHSES